MLPTQTEPDLDTKDSESIQNSESSYYKLSFGTFTILAQKPENNS